MTPIQDIQTCLKEGKTILLSGGFSTELHRKGIRTALPLWSASALFTHPEVVKQVHREYIDAGADVITTNTFRTNSRTFGKVGGKEKAKEATRIACDIARTARTESGKNGIAIGGCVAPVEDCYTPALTPPDDELRAEHAEFVGWLKDGGVDFIFIETMPTIREARIAAEAAHAAGLPFITSFVCSPEGNLLSGEPLEDAIAAIAPLNPLAFSTNCRPLSVIEPSVDVLLKKSPVPVAVYANGDGEPDDDIGWRFLGENHEATYLTRVEGWLGKGVRIIGGCCGTTPAYIKRMRELLSSR